MERWASNALRIIGIIVTSIIVVCGCLFLVLLSECAAKGGFSGSGNRNDAATYMFGAVILGLAGIALIAWLGRGIYRSSQPPAAPTPSSPLTSLGRLSPAGQRSINVLTGSLAAQIAVSALSWIYSVLQMQRMPATSHSLVPVFFFLFLLYAAPYAALIYPLQARPSRMALAFALAVPVASVLTTLVTNMHMVDFYMRNPASFATLGISLAVDIVIVVLAVLAAQRTGLQSSIASLVAAVAASLVYFYALQLVSPILYRAMMR